ncbi:MAG: cadherin domain-containing protein [Marinifilaceae bacterium]|nr:cadherin domain-containing protein [Marinifilaceae bacterium]
MLDYESGTKSFDISFSIADGKNQTEHTISINVTDENDNIPVIVQNPDPINVNNNFAVDQAIYTVNANDLDTDDNTNLSNWRIVGGNELGLFKIDPDTGVISLAKKDTDNHLLEIELQIMVSDGELNSQISTITIIMNTLMGIDDLHLTENDFILYPNPSTNFFVIKSTNYSELLSLQILDYTGKILIVNDKYQLNSPVYHNLAKGNYILRIKGNEVNKSFKLNVK